VTADWHADAVTAGEERYADVEQAARVPMSYAIASDCPESRSLFVFAGDLTNPDPPRCWRAVRMAMRIAEELESHGIPTLWLTGNHDVLEDGVGSHSLMPLDVGARLNRLREVVAEPGYVTMLGVPILCLPYVARSHAYDPVEFVMNTSRALTPALIVGHLMIKGIGPGSETKDFARGRDIFLPLDEIQRLWLDVPIVNGHYHAAQMFRRVHIPGSVARFTLGEAHNSTRFLEIDL
jgi:DNA repair exonuclease SbcCD nuclease subunit